MIRRVVCSALLVLAACVPPPRRARVRPSPCTPPVAPIRNQAIIVVININFSYTPQDETGARSDDRDAILEELNSDGQPDGNTFAEPNGDQHNFTMNYSISNDGQDHFTGGLEFSGWGQGFIHSFGRYQYSYSSVDKLVRDLSDDAYGFVHDGWHDSRPSCSATR